MVGIASSRGENGWGDPFTDAVRSVVAERGVFGELLMASRWHRGCKGPPSSVLMLPDDFFL